MREVYRDRWIVVVDKPAGLPSQPQPDAHDDVYTLLNAQQDYVGLHHRLDVPASGLLLLTCDTRANAAVAEAFRSHAIARTYAAVLAGDRIAPGETAVWNAEIDHQPASSQAHVVGAGNGMRAAFLTLTTGRTHQLRRHAALSGMPIVGDRRHGGDAGGWWPRLALHATRLQLLHPVTEEPLDLRAPVPDDMAKLWRMTGGTELAE